MTQQAPRPAFLVDTERRPRLDEVSVNCTGCGSRFNRPLEGPGKSRVRCDRCSPARRGQFKLGERTFVDLDTLTRDQVFASKVGTADPWGVARSTIQQHARDRFAASEQARVCRVCGYSKHVEVAHVVGVMTWPGNTLIGAINSLDNLVALCPTHHVEFDSGTMDPEDLTKITGP